MSRSWAGFTSWYSSTIKCRSSAWTAERTSGDFEFANGSHNLLPVSEKSVALQRVEVVEKHFSERLGMSRGLSSSFSMTPTPSKNRAMEPNNRPLSSSRFRSRRVASRAKTPSADGRRVRRRSQTEGRASEGGESSTNGSFRRIGAEAVKGRSAEPLLGPFGDSMSKLGAARSVNVKATMPAGSTPSASSVATRWRRPRSFPNQLRR